MDTIHVAIALFSAVLHAGWNAAIKASPRPHAAMAAQMHVSALLVVPGLLWTGLPAPAAWIWIAASTAMNMITVAALLRAYELAGFGLVYPVGRAVSVLLVVPLAAWLAGERISPAGLLGVGLITAALGLLALSAQRDRSLTLPAIGWTLVAGVSTALYVLSDAQGVRSSGSSWAYGFAIIISNAIAMSGAMSWRQRHIGSPLKLLRSDGAVAIPSAVAAMISYLAILWVWTQAPIAPASALRDTSAVFAILIAVIWLREPMTGLRLLAVGLAAAAIPLLRLA
jgi:drug/metabolite transporter (DMT)-like permease